MEMQQALMGAKSAVIISPAPMFGVKLIEGILNAVDRYEEGRLKK